MINKEPFRKINTLSGHTDEITYLSWSPHEQALASYSRDRVTIIWQDALKEDTSNWIDNDSREPVWNHSEYGLIKHDAKEKTFNTFNPFSRTSHLLLRLIDISPRQFWPGSSFIACDDNKNNIYIFNIKEHIPVGNFNLTDLYKEIHELKFSPSENNFIITTFSGSLILFKTILPEKIKARHSSEKYGLKCAWSPDGDYVVADWDRGSIRIWDNQLKELNINLLESGGSKKSFSFSPNGELFIVHGNNKKIQFFETNTWTEIYSHDIGDSFIPTAFHPAKPLLASVAEDNTEIHIWEYNTEAILENAEKLKIQAKVDLAQQFGASPAVIKKLEESVKKKISTKKTKKKKTTKKKIEKKKVVKKVTPDKDLPKPKDGKIEATPVSVQLAIKAISDRPIEESGQDLLNYSVYAKALREFIMLKDTETPLTIAIDAPWGRGKSSIMNMMKNELKEYGLIPVWFNAWRYEKAENLWAALALRVMDTLNKRLTLEERIRFNWQILADRFIEDKLKDNLQDLILKGASLLISFVLKTVFGSIAPLKLNLNQLLPGPNYRQRAGFLNSFQKDFKIIVENIKKFEESKIELRKKLPRNIEKADKGRIVIFIDDLDRCPPPKPVEIIEAINVILDVENCVFVLGMDLDMICASIETKYKSLREYFTKMDESRDPRIGQRFMEKIVELNFRIPPPDGTEIDNLYDSFMVKEEHPEDQSKKPGDTQRKTQSESASKLDKQKHYEEVNKVVTEIENSMEDNERVADAVKKYRQTQKGVNANIMRDVEYHLASEKQTIDNEPFRKAIETVAKEMEPNPRKIKRFVNIFKMKATVAELKNKLDENLTIERLAQWTYLYMDWPDLGRATIENPDVLEYLIDFAQENTPSELPAVKKKLTDKSPSLTKKLSEWENDTDLIKFLKSLKEFDRNLLVKLKSF